MVCGERGERWITLMSPPHVSWDCRPSNINFFSIEAKNIRKKTSLLIEFLSNYASYSFVKMTPNMPIRFKHTLSVDGHGQLIRMQPMHFLSEARNWNDDWTGLTEREKRKRLQNRLHQRSWSMFTFYIFILSVEIHSKKCWDIDETVRVELTRQQGEDNASFRQTERKLFPL